MLPNMIVAESLRWLSDVRIEIQKRVDSDKETFSKVGRNAFDRPLTRIRLKLQDTLVGMFVQCDEIRLICENNQHIAMQLEQIEKEIVDDEIERLRNNIWENVRCCYNVLIGHPPKIIPNCDSCLERKGASKSAECKNASKPVSVQYCEGWYGKTKVLPKTPNIPPTHISSN